MQFSRQEYWSGLPRPGDLPNPGIKPVSFMSPALAGRFFTTSATWEALGPFYQAHIHSSCSTNILLMMLNGQMDRKGGCLKRYACFACWLSSWSKLPSIKRLWIYPQPPPSSTIQPKEATTPTAALLPCPFSKAPPVVILPYQKIPTT